MVPRPTAAPQPSTERSSPAAPSLTERLKERYFGGDEHPYDSWVRTFEQHLAPEHGLFEIGCGYDAPVLRRYEGRVRERVGLDLVEFTDSARESGIRLIRGDAAHTGLDDASIDLVVSRAVMEHLERPLDVYREVHRVLRPGGRFVFLTANLGDYASWISMAVPNRLHPWIVRKTEGRDEADTFPAHYRCNSGRSIRRLCRESGLELERLDYLGQYPCYFQFNPVLFLIATGYEKLISRFEALRFLRGWLLGVLRKPPADADQPSPSASSTA